MPELKIGRELWQTFVAVAEKQKRKPEALARDVLRDYLRRVSDEELLQQSSAAARRTSFRMEETEEIIRQYRRSFDM